MTNPWVSALSAQLAKRWMDRQVVGEAEAERYVQDLRGSKPEDIGSCEWSRQRERLERLNVQAHANAQEHSHEFVKELLVSRGRVHELVRELLALEAWRERALPRMLESVASSSAGHTQCYLAAHSEATVANLLELTFFHQDACEAAGDDALIELVDWCFRKVSYLLSPSARSDALESTQRSVHEEVNLSPEDDLRSKVASSRFATASCSLTILRYLTGFMHSLPLGVMARLLDVHDAPVNIVALIDQAPWLRERDAASNEGHITEVFEGGAWTELGKHERLRITIPQAQCWLALCNLVLDPQCRGRYVWDEQRQERLQRVKRHFNEVLFDQIPTLKELQRAVDEILLNQGPQAGDVKQGRLVMEQVPEMRKELTEKTEDEWQQIADRQASSVFADTAEARKAATERIESLTELFDAMAELGSGEANSMVDQNSQRSSNEKQNSDASMIEQKRKKSSVLDELFPSGRTVEEGNSAGELTENCTMEEGMVRLRALQRQNGRWLEASAYEMDMQTDEEPAAVDIGKGKDAMHGKRYKCRFRTSMNEGKAKKALPSQGHAEVTTRGKTATAKLDLPLVKSLKQDGTLLDADQRELPKAAWITMGVLSKDGVVLQVKVKRMTKPSEDERDSNTGAYRLYTPSVVFVTVKA